MRGGGWAGGLAVGLPELESLLALERASESAEVTRISIGPRLHASLQQEALIARLAAFPRLAIILLADDWIPDGDMASVRRAFEKALPEVQFLWIYAGLAGGKHGR